MAEDPAVDPNSDVSSEGIKAPKSKGLSPMMKTAIVAVVVVILVAVPMSYFILKGGEESDVDITVTVVGKASEDEVTYDDLEAMDFVEAVSSYQNSFGNWRGLGTYGGVELRDIADLVGGMEPGDVMTVSAADGYRANLTYYQVYADDDCLAIQGRMILAYEFNGSIMEEDERPMIAVLAPDQAFSNDDFTSTCSRDPEFLSSTSAGSLWVKTVEKIEISELYEEWTINLTGLDNVTRELTRTEFVNLAYYNSGEWTDSIDRTWTGANLSAVLGLIDDDDPSSYNETLADTEYQVQVSASDGYSKTMIAKYLVENESLVANMMNGTALDEDYAPLKIVGAGMSSGQMVSMIASITLLEPEVPDEVVLTIEGDTTIDLLMSDVQDLTAMISYGGFKKSTGTVEGPFEFTGVPLKDLIDMVYSGDDYSLEVVATDGYTMTYSYSQVEDGTFAYYNLDGDLMGTGDFTMIVAYAQDGEPLVDMDLRIAIVDDSEPITDGHFWAKYVRTVRVVGAVADWTLALNGTTVYSMDRQTFESLASCEYHAASWSFENETGTHTYTGVALWTLVSAVDGADGPDTEYLFNDLLAFAGYDVRVTADDGYNKVFTSMQVARNDTIIVANRLDGEPLEEDNWPLKIVGDWLSGSMKVGQIVNISMEGLQPVPDWELTLIGTRTVTISAETFASIYYSGLHGPWFNYTNYGGWHAAYHNFTNATGDHTYAGIPLWVLVAAVDGEDLYHYEFNETLADEGYDVKVIASDDYNYTFPISAVEYNNSMVVAFMLDWTALIEDNYPLKLTGEELLGSQKIKSVATIELIGLP
jgi:DMSO/TMAO reductase YedYZ molybdopterin-dependent catalytic subunit